MHPLADVGLARRIERGWAWAADESARCYAAVRPEAGVAVEPFGTGNAAYYGNGSPLSQAQGLGFDGPVSDADLDRLEAFFRSRGAAATIEAASLADPGLLPALSRRGFLIVEQSHVLARPVDPLPRPPVEGIAVEHVAPDDAAGQALLAETILRAFFEEPDVPPDAIGDVLKANAASPAMTGWLATIHGVPVGGGTLLVHEGAALFAGDATSRHSRGRGVQAALIAARLAHAAAVGCDLAVSCTQPGTTSQRNYERQGFWVAYARTMLVKE